MVVSAILTTALAPITGALFGASYGTSIRIGYEIIFPALFGDMINDQKNNPTKMQEQGTKRTIQAMHKMFQGVGGAAAMEFGIEQGIEMAKKKTASPEVQNMIDLSLGLTEAQLNKRGKATSFSQGGPESSLTPQQELEQSKQKEGFATPSHDVGEKNIMAKNYPDTTQGNADLYKIMNFGSDFGKRNTAQKKALIALYSERLKLGRFERLTTKEALDKFSPAESIVNKIATMFNQMVLSITRYRQTGQSRFAKTFTLQTKEYNRFVQRNGKRALTVDVHKSIVQKKIIKRFT